MKKLLLFLGFVLLAIVSFCQDTLTVDLMGGKYCDELHKYAVRFIAYDSKQHKLITIYAEAKVLPEDQKPKKGDKIIVTDEFVIHNGIKYTRIKIC